MPAESSLSTQTTTNDVNSNKTEIRTCAAISAFGPSSNSRRANEPAVLKFFSCKVTSNSMTMIPGEVSQDSGGRHLVEEVEGSSKSEDEVDWLEVTVSEIGRHLGGGGSSTLPSDCLAHHKFVRYSIQSVCLLNLLAEKLSLTSHCLFCSSKLLCNRHKAGNIANNTSAKWVPLAFLSWSSPWTVPGCTPCR